MIIKLYETERQALNRRAPSEYDRLPTERMALHDGMTGFLIGRGDMIANLYRRARSVCATESPAALIVLQLLDRASEHDTVLGRFRRIHENPGTARQDGNDRSASISETVPRLGQEDLLTQKFKMNGILA